MSQFDVFRLAGARALFVVDLQADLLSELPTRIVAPLRRLPASTVPMENVNPIVGIDGEEYIVALQQLASVPRRDLKQSIANLSEHRSALVRGIDVLLAGV